MSYFLRFTNTLNETGFQSEDQPTGEFYDGLCCYDLTETVEQLIEEYSEEDGTITDEFFEEALSWATIKQLRSNAWHFSNSDGYFVWFSSVEIGKDKNNIDCENKVAVIASSKANDLSYVAHGRAVLGQYGYGIKDIKLN